jgi:hypothetical protein
MAGKRIKANKGLTKAKNKVKKFARTFSPLGVADAVGDYLLPKKSITGKPMKTKKNGRN